MPLKDVTSPKSGQVTSSLSIHLACSSSFCAAATLTVLCSIRVCVLVCIQSLSQHNVATPHRDVVLVRTKKESVAPAWSWKMKMALPFEVLAFWFRFFLDAPAQAKAVAGGSEQHSSATRMPLSSHSEVFQQQRRRDKLLVAMLIPLSILAALVFYWVHISPTPTLAAEIAVVALLLTVVARRLSLVRRLVRARITHEFDYQPSIAKLSSYQNKT
jgi:hypothetical protein